MFAIASLLPMIQAALGVIGAFKGSAAQAKTTSKVQDAISVVAAVTPLIQQFGAGTEVTEDQVRAALAGMDAALADFDAEIARQQAQGKP
jgi:hypothetical protein